MSPDTSITRLVDTDQPLDDDALAEAYATDRSRPWLRINFVASVDGAVEVGGYSKGLSSPPDQRLLKLLRTHCDALLLGAGTLRREGYGPIALDAKERAWRLERGLSEHPTLVVVSGTLRLDPARPAFAEAPVRPIVLTRAAAPEPVRAALSNTADVLVLGEEAVDLTAGVAALHERGLRQLLCEGGPHLFGSLTAADLVDEVCLTVSPRLTGPGAGRITAGPASPIRRMALRHVLTAPDALFLRYVRA
jgi:riboflavin biosynthesis pyrimidine reductase